MLQKTRDNPPNRAVWLYADTKTVAPDFVIGAEHWTRARCGGGRTGARYRPPVSRTMGGPLEVVAGSDDDGQEGLPAIRRNCHRYHK